MATADLSKMSYLEWCIKESMRLLSPVPTFSRNLIKETEFRRIMTVLYLIIYRYTSMNYDNVYCERTDIIVCYVFLSQAILWFWQILLLRWQRFVSTIIQRFTLSLRSPTRQNSNRADRHVYSPFSAGPGNCIGESSPDPK